LKKGKFLIDIQNYYSKTRISTNADILKAIWRHALVPLTVLTLYFVLFSWFLSWYLPKQEVNVNSVFVSLAWKLSLLLAMGLYLIYFAFFQIARGNKLSFGNIEKFYFGDFFLILLPLTPIVQYILNNQDVLSLSGSLLVFANFAIFSIIIIIVMPTLLDIVGSNKTLMSLGLAFTTTITGMALLSFEFHWFEEGSLPLQLLFFVAIFLVSRIIYRLNGRKVLYFIVAICFLANSVVSAIPLVSDRQGKNELGVFRGAIDDASANNKLIELVGSKNPISTPNVYLLVYDAYVINETMLGYGINNSAQERYLEELGFKLYPHTYSLAAASIDSMSRTLMASTEYYGYVREGVAGNGIVHHLFKSFGYETYGIFRGDYFFWAIGSNYDVSFPESVTSAHKYLLKSIYMGEFRFDVQFNEPLFEKESRGKFVEYKLSILGSVSDKPRFIYVHTDRPNHSQNSGVLLPNEIELFKGMLIEANGEMKQDIEAITQKDPGAIIVVAGDHGPYLTKNGIDLGGDYDISEVSRLDIQDRFGTFLAIKWPTEDFSKYDDITVLQDLFPAIFSYLFKDDKILEAKVAPDTIDSGEIKIISGVSVKNGIIYGGADDGEPLFIDQR